MLTATAATIVGIIGGDILIGSEDVIGNDIVIDSREATPGCIFVALPGEQADGHDFLQSALDGGARVLLVTRPLGEIVSVAEEAKRRGAVLIRVDDALRAIQDLALWHRNRLHATVIGITGSTGKTTSKDFITAVLRTSLRVVSTTGNRNNELGMPLTLLSAGSESDVVVLEMGMRGLGQIARLAEIARPDVGLVTNVGTSHLEILGTQDAVAAAKGELVRSVPAEGAVFLNGDDAYSDALAMDSAAPVTTYGLDERCKVRAVDVQLDELSRACFKLVSPEGSASVSLPIPGRHNVYNALAAAAVGLHVGVPLDRVVAGLSQARITSMRMETFTTAGGITVVNDSYNANPSSMRAAIETLATMQSTGRRIAVLGDMAELGSLSELAHFELGESFSELPIQLLVTVGPRAKRIGDGAIAAGRERDSVYTCATADEASEVLDDLLESGDIILVKASRVMGLERVVEGIVTPRAG